MSGICNICGKPYSSFEQYSPHECLNLRDLKAERDALRAELAAAQERIVILNRILFKAGYCADCGGLVMPGAHAVRKGHAPDCVRKLKRKIETLTKNDKRGR